MRELIFEPLRRIELKQYKEKVYELVGLKGMLPKGRPWDMIVENHFKNGYSEESSARILEEVFLIR